MPEETTDLSRLADAWLAGWDAGKDNKPESVCPFGSIASVETNLFAAMWVRGWHAGVRQDPADHKAKKRFLAMSLGLQLDGRPPATEGDP